MLWLVRKIGPAIFDGLGGINTQAIMDGFDLFDIDRAARPVLFERILAYCMTVNGER